MTPEALVSACFPIETAGRSLVLVPETVNEDTGEVLGGFYGDEGEVIAVLQLVRWEVGAQGRTVRDVKEQRVTLVPRGAREAPRLAEYIAGWAEAVRVVFAEHDERAAAGTLPDELAEALERAGPAELAGCDVLAMRRPRSAADFTDALLRGRRRLGRFLP